LIASPLPDTSPVGKKAGTTSQWVDLLPLPGTLKEPFEIKVYEIDDMAPLQRRQPGNTTEASARFSTCSVRHYLAHAFIWVIQHLWLHLCRACFHSHSTNNQWKISSHFMPAAEGSSPRAAPRPH
ncbi:hypothetical protein MATL_G00207860, partial [Megalops atlanticus]